MTKKLLSHLSFYVVMTFCVLVTFGCFAPERSLAFDQHTCYQSCVDAGIGTGQDVRGECLFTCAREQARLNPPVAVPVDEAARKQQAINVFEGLGLLVGLPYLIFILLVLYGLRSLIRFLKS